MRNEIKSSLTSNLQDRRAMLETRSRSQAKSLAEHRARSGSQARGKGMFEDELAKVAHAPDDLANRPNERVLDEKVREERRSSEKSADAPRDSRKAQNERMPERMAEKRSEPAAKSERSEDLRSHSGAGTESRLRDNRAPSTARESVERQAGEDGEGDADREIAFSSRHTNRGSSPDGESSRMKIAQSNSANSEGEEIAEEETDDVTESGMAEAGLQAAHASHHRSEHPKDGTLLDANAPVESTDGIKPKGLAKNVKGSAGLSANSSGVTHVATTPKQKAMLELLEAMHQEIGVPPEKILQAFSEMSESGLNAPPEETMKEFIGQLSADAKLNPQQTLRASSLYGKFLGDVAQADFDETLNGLAATQISPDGGLGAEALQKLDRSVGDLQKSLQAVGQTPEQLQAEIARLMQVSQALKSARSGSSGESDFLAAGLGDEDESLLNDLSGKDLESLRVQNDKNSALAFGGIVAGQENASQSGAFGQSGGQSMGQNGGQGAGQNGGQSSPHASVKSAGASTGNSLRSEMERAMKGMSGTDRGQVSNSMTGADGATVTGQSSLGPQGTSKSMPLAAAAGETAFGVKMSPKDEEANVKELMKQAQLIVKKGGGEMKLEMSPEGMGKVHLKVGVENGQVSVQMLAESDAAKKMLENNLQDLRASLVAHKLHVDQLKVDTAKVDGNADIHKQMDQQTNGDAGREQARQMARDFMSEFRDDREGFRQGFFDRTQRGYSKAIARADVRPEAVSAMSARKTGAVSRLNLVA